MTRTVTIAASSTGPRCLAVLTKSRHLHKNNLTAATFGIYNPRGEKKEEVRDLRSSVHPRARGRIFFQYSLQKMPRNPPKCVIDARSKEYLTEDIHRSAIG